MNQDFSILTDSSFSDSFIQCPNCSRDERPSSSNANSVYTVSPPSAAVNTLLNSNEAPLQSQMLQQSLAEAKSVAASLSSRLSILQAEVNSLTARSDSVNTFIQTYNKVLHPIRRTPPEVLLEIFSYCTDFVDTEHHSPSGDSLDTKKAPWSLGQVCKYWRTVVLECPRLWSSLALDLRKPHHNNPDPRKLERLDMNAVLLLSHHLKRSKDCSLKIAITSPRGMHPLLSQVYSHCARWKEAYLALPVEGFQALSASVKGCLPMLESIHLRDLVPGSSWVAAGPIDAFQYAPNLACVRTHAIPSINTSLRLPYDQLGFLKNTFPTSLEPISSEMAAGSNTTNMDVLMKGMRLHQAILFCADISFVPPPPPAGVPPVQVIPPLPVTMRVTHMGLTSLTIDLVRRSLADLVVQLVDRLTLPALRTLRVCLSSRRTNGTNTAAPDVRAIVRLIDRSDCALIKVRLKGFDMRYDGEDSSPANGGTGSGMRALIKLIPGVQVLCLDRMEDSLVEALVAAAPAPAPIVIPDDDDDELYENGGGFGDGDEGGSPIDVDALPPSQSQPQTFASASTSITAQLTLFENEPLLPRLRHLRISGTCPHQSEMNQARFVDMLESRQKNASLMLLQLASTFTLSDPDAKRRLGEGWRVGSRGLMFPRIRGNL